MSMPIIRPILKKDNKQIASVIRGILVDFGVPKVGTAYADVTLDTMFEAYQKPRSIYFIIELDGKVLGGGGISQLDNSEENICELQKCIFPQKLEAWA